MADGADKSNEPFRVGKIIGFHGLRGAVKVHPSTNNPDLLRDIESVEIEIKPGILEVATVDTIKFEKGNLVLTFIEYEDRSAVEPLLGAMVFTERSQLADLEDDEWWTKDLIGLDVFTTDGAHVGTVHDIITGAGELLEIKKLGVTDDKTSLVPFVKALVPVVDLKRRRIEISNLPGLLD